MTKYLTLQDLGALFALVKAEVAQKGMAFYGWVNSPEVKEGSITHISGWGDAAQTREVSVEEAFKIYEGKINGAYGERFALSMALLAGLVRQGKKVALLQVKEEAGVPFDATGWMVVSLEGNPMFHIAPWDLPMAKVAELGLITLVYPRSDEAQEHAHKGTNKVSEFGMILDWML